VLAFRCLRTAEPRVTMIRYAAIRVTAGVGESANGRSLVIGLAVLVISPKPVRRRPLKTVSETHAS